MNGAEFVPRQSLGPPRYPIILALKNSYPKQGQKKYTDFVRKRQCKMWKDFCYRCNKTREK